MKKFIYVMVVSAAASLAFAEDIFVAPNGNDSWLGTKENPLASLNGAKTVAEKFWKNGGGKEIKILLRGGIYFFKESVFFDKSSKIPEGASVSIEAYENEEVVFHGGKKVSVSAFKEVADKNILSKLPPEKADGKLYSLSLKEHGLENCGELVQRGFGQNKVTQGEPFLDGKPLNIARFPNGEFEYVQVGEVLSKKNEKYHFTFEFDRPLRWLDAKNLWLTGHFRRGWCDQFVKVDKIDAQTRSIKAANGGGEVLEGKAVMLRKSKNKRIYDTSADIRGYRAFNILEEADRHGEYVIDTSNDKLFIIINEPSKYKFLDFSLLETPFVVLDGVENFSISKIKFRCSRGNGLFMSAVSNIKIDKCEFNNLGLAGIAMDESLALDREKKIVQCRHDQMRPVVTNSKNISLTNSKFYDLGDGGALIIGGNRLTLENSNNRIANCEFFRTSRINRSYSAAIRVYGCGGVIENCHIYDLPHEAIAHNGNDFIIRRNLIENVSNFSDDMGAIYGGANFTERGTVIEENFLRNIRSHLGDKVEICGVYIDDGNGGVTVRRNLFCNVGTMRGAFFSHGGFDNYVTRNVFIDCMAWARYDFWDNKNLQKRLTNYKYRFDELKDSLEMYNKKYPTLPNCNGEKGILNYLEKNRIFRCNGPLRGVFYLAGNELLQPNEELAEKVDWTVEKVKKYFGGDGIVDEVTGVKFGIQK